MLLKKIVGAIALAGAAVPVAMVVRKQLNKRAALSKLASARDAARKAPHARKPRKERRIARHLAKALEGEAV